MIGVDTNVLLRLFVNDDARQHAAARAWFEQRSAADPAYVCLVVLLEFVWSLKRTYRYSQAEIDRLMAALVTATDIRLEQAEIVEEAMELATARQGGFADAVVMLANRAAGCPSTVTFDEKAAARLPAMKPLA